jgi:hypothetical protein
LAARSKSGERLGVKIVNDASRCAVCGLCDVRGLLTLRLTGGAQVTVCGTHDLMHRRIGGVARTLQELCAKMTERREPSERRDSLPGDDLGNELTAAFAGERRGERQRRRA